MALLPFRKKAEVQTTTDPKVVDFLQDFSIEVMPRTLEKLENVREHLPENTRVYIAHIEGTPIEDMVATAKRLAGDGYRVMPHFPARIIKDETILSDWIARYQGEANVSEGLMLAGGVADPHGKFDS
ncbi:MAG: methylenetetrahydrofolate reductase, partial [Boseongicola sp.]|nr:methylenetetrahydrofolate reductase [Boseongicola sp.]